MTTSGMTINIPLALDFQPVDQAETVETDFVNVEIENAINDIVDYEKVRLTPVDDNDVQLNSITYKLNLLDSTNTFPAQTTYGSEEYSYDDLKFRKNKFKRSFLRLSFYDTDIPTNQNLITFMTLFCRLRTSDLVPVSTLIGNPNQNTNLPLPVFQIPIRFTVEDPVMFPEGIAEGYFLYHFKDDIPNELYMRASWNNAKTGKSVALITTNVPQTIDNLVDKLHMKYILKRTTTGWYYEIDQTYSSPTNVIVSGNNMTINLYEIQAI
jgi:hypothetical protein